MDNDAAREILDAAAVKFGYRPAQLQGRGRTAHLASARRHAVLELRRAGFSWREIGRTLHRAHPSVMAIARATAEEPNAEDLA
jgi:chromosomal replication initiation ATPase DnaA